MRKLMRFSLSEKERSFMKKRFEISFNVHIGAFMQ